MRFEQQLATARQLVPAAGAADREMARVLEGSRRAGAGARSRGCTPRSPSSIGAPSLSRLHRDIPGFTVRAENGAHAEMKHQTADARGARGRAPRRALPRRVRRADPRRRGAEHRRRLAALLGVPDGPRAAALGVRRHPAALRRDVRLAGGQRQLVGRAHPPAAAVPDAARRERAPAPATSRRCCRRRARSSASTAAAASTSRSPTCRRGRGSRSTFAPCRRASSTRRAARARAGYWSVAARDDASGAYAKARAGRVSLYHGFPFTAKPEYDLVA